MFAETIVVLEKFKEKRIKNKNIVKKICDKKNCDYAQNRDFGPKL